MRVHKTSPVLLVFLLLSSAVQADVPQFITYSANYTHWRESAADFAHRVIDKMLKSFDLQLSLFES
jgi:hypothetical protein